jgi:hypothetical protein
MQRGPPSTFSPRLRRSRCAPAGPHPRPRVRGDAAPLPLAQLQRFNIGVACADAQPPTRLALIHRAPDGQTSRYTFGVATIEAEVMASYRLTQTDDHQEAKRAFAEKRRPLFRGR